MEYKMEPFAEVKILGRWPVVLPDYRVEHCRVSPNWEEGRLLSMHAHLKHGDVLYDVGAEHGDLSALYGTWVQGCSECGSDRESAGMVLDIIHEHNTGGVVLVEGSDKFWPVIKATFEANGLEPAGCYAGFASDHVSPDEMRGPGWPTSPRVPRGEWPSWADGPAAAHHGFKSVVESQDTIPNTTFDHLAEWFGPPDAMTIDVEGAELLVLKGSERLLRSHQPKHVWVSIHPTLIAMDYPESGIHGTGDPDRERERVLEFMDEMGYRHEFIETNHEEHHYFSVE